MAYKRRTLQHDGTYTDEYLCTLDEYKIERIADMKQACTDDIMTVAPDYKQRNAAMGIYDATKNQGIINWVQKQVQQCNTLEAQINACTTCDDVAAISWVLDETPDEQTLWEKIKGLLPW
jgi:hypothetical protein